MIDSEYQVALAKQLTVNSKILKSFVVDTIITLIISFVILF